MANPEKQTSDPHGGLSASGTTADQMHPGEPGPGTTYGDPGGTGTADQESAAQPPADQESAAQPRADQESAAQPPADQENAPGHTDDGEPETPAP